MNICAIEEKPDGDAQETDDPNTITLDASKVDVQQLLQFLAGQFAFYSVFIYIVVGLI